MPSVRQVAVIGIADDKWGERPLAIVVAQNPQDQDAEAIRTHVSQYVERGILSRWAIPERIEFVTEIDQTSVGKIDKKSLRQKYG